MALMSLRYENFCKIIFWAQKENTLVVNCMNECIT